MGLDLRLQRPLSQGQRDAAVTLAALLLVLAWDASPLDLRVAHAFGTAQGFPWREHWLTRDVLHTGGRWLAFGVLAALALQVARPFAGTLTRGERVRWLLVTLAALLLVPLLKKISQTSCPWELTVFGGVARHVSHWLPGVADGGSGHCFPSRHATSAFAFFSGWFALRGCHPHAARAWLAAVLVAGLLFGLAQTARGAHYVSHSLWTGWLCWALAAGVAALARRAPVATAVPAR